jgi:hypothetical protein
MRQLSSAFRRFVPLGLFLAASSASLAQVIHVGYANADYYSRNLNPSGVETVFQLSGTANADGAVTTAVFGWSNSPCPAAVKIKFFRPVSVVGVNPHGALFLAERGPFDVTQPLNSSGFGPPVTQNVVLNPPVQLRAGDIIAITNTTSCGGPTFIFDLPYLGPLPPRVSVAVPGDVVSGVFLPNDPPYAPPVFAAASGGDTALELLGRFEISLVAVDSRTGRQTAGSPIPLTRSAGYFSLPDFTGDPAFPEVMVKMVDATGAPSLGGTFWFFHAPLTDVQYTVTVTDLTTAKVKTYTNASANPGQLCGGVDTSAFPGP